MTNTVSKNRPDVSVEIHRYDDPGAWSFVQYTRCAWTDAGAEAPIFDAYDDVLGSGDISSLQWYSRSMEGLLDSLHAGLTRHTLEGDGYVKTPWKDLDDDLKLFIVNNVTPIEWHSPLEMGDVHYTDRVIVRLKYDPVTAEELADPEKVRSMLNDPNHVWVF